MVSRRDLLGVFAAVFVGSNFTGDRAFGDNDARRADVRTDYE